MGGSPRGDERVSLIVLGGQDPCKAAGLVAVELSSAPGGAGSRLVARCGASFTRATEAFPPGESRWVTISLDPQQRTARFFQGLEKSEFASCSVELSGTAGLALEGIGAATHADDLSVVSTGRCHSRLSFEAARVILDDSPSTQWNSPGRPALVATSDAWQMFFSVRRNAFENEIGIAHGWSQDLVNWTYDTCPSLVSIKRTTCQSSTAISAKSEPQLTPEAPAAVSRGQRLVLLYELQDEFSGGPNVGLGAALSRDGGRTFVALRGAAGQRMVIAPAATSSGAGAISPTALWTSAGIEVFQVQNDDSARSSAIIHHVCNLAGTAGPLTCKHLDSHALEQPPKIHFEQPYLSYSEEPAPVWPVSDLAVLVRGNRYLLYTHGRGAQRNVRLAAWSSTRRRWIQVPDLKLDATELGLTTSHSIWSPTVVAHPAGLHLLVSVLSGGKTGIAHAVSRQVR